MLTREGGHRANRIVHAGGDATGAEVQRALHAAVHRDPVDPAGRARAGAGPAARRRTAGPAASRCTCSARARRTASARSSPARWCWPPAAWARSSRPPPTRRCPPATASRWRCGPARRSPTSSSSSSTRPRSFLPGNEHAAQQPLISEALRGEGAHLVDGDGKRFMVGPARAGRAGAARRGGQGHPPGDAAPTGADHVYPGRPAPRRRVPRAAVPDDRRVLPGRRRRPGRRPDPGRPGRPLRLRRRPHRPARPHVDPRPVRLRRGRLHRRARRQPAGQQLAAGGAGLRPPDRRRTSRAELPPQADAGARSRTATGWVVDPGGPAGAAERDDPRAPACCARRRRSPDRGRGARPGSARPAATPQHRELGGDQPADGGHRAGRPPRRPGEETRGCHWREDFPDGRRRVARPPARRARTGRCADQDLGAAARERGDRAHGCGDGRARPGRGASGSSTTALDEDLGTGRRRRDQRGHHPGRPGRHRRPGGPRGRGGRRAGRRRRGLRRSSTPVPASRSRRRRRRRGWPAATCWPR